MKEQTKQNELVLSFQAIHNEYQLGESDAKAKLRNQLNKLELEIEDLKRRITFESEKYLKKETECEDLRKQLTQMVYFILFHLFIYFIVFYLI